MKIRGIVWAGVRTHRFGAMVAFCRDVLGIDQTLEGDAVAFFDAPGGDRLELFAADGSEGEGVRIGFLVEDVAAARAELETAGVEFLGPVHTNAEGYVWTNFRAPDGNVYSLTYFPGHPAL